MARKIKKLVVYATQAAYLDPGECDSMLAYSITGRRYLRAHVDLSDCNRKITWYFDDGAECMRKIDRAIFLLTSFRTDLLRAKKEFKRRPKRTKAVKRNTIH